MEFAAKASTMTNVASERARRMRKEKTAAERKLWQALRELNRQGHQFRQQAPIGPYIADFADHTARFVIEVDGGQHGEDEQRKRDSDRTSWLESQGYRVRQYWNVDVPTNLDGVMTEVLLVLGRISDVVVPPIPNPSPQAGGGQERGP